MFSLNSPQDIEDFTHGCCFFGTGGGGPAEFGQKMLLDALDAGKKIEIIDPNTLKDNQWIVCPYLMGTSGPETNDIRQAKIKYGLSFETIKNMSTAATNLLLKEAKEPITLSAIIPYEIGGAATASAVATAAWLGVPVIDADFVGRSVPEATQMLPALYGIDLSPTASSDAYGNETIIHKTINRHMTERLGKFIASASFGLIGQATLLRQVKLLRAYMFDKTLSKAFAVGKALRSSLENKENIESILNSLIGSQKIFSGKINQFHGYDQEGYYVGEIIIRGNAEYQNNELKIWFKNENHIAWLNGEVYLTSPELISILDNVTHKPYTNSQLREGFDVTVYGTPCQEAWYKEDALSAQCPRYYGFDFDAKFLSLPD